MPPRHPAAALRAVFQNSVYCTVALKLCKARKKKKSKADVRLLSEMFGFLGNLATMNAFPFRRCGKGCRYIIAKKCTNVEKFAESIFLNKSKLNKRGKCFANLTYMCTYQRNMVKKKKSLYTIACSN